MSLSTPRLPQFCVVVACIDLVYAVSRLMIATLGGRHYWHAFGGYGHGDWTVTCVLAVLVFAAAYVGDLGLLRKWRYAPYFQAFAQLPPIVELARHILVVPAEQSRVDRTLVEVLFWLSVVWGFVVAVSVEKSLRFFRVLHSPRDATMADLKKLASGAGFERLHLKFNNNLDDSVGRILAQHKSLIELDLSDTSIGDDGVRPLVDLPCLKRLNLSATQVTDAVFGLLLNAAGLEEVRLLATRCTPQRAAEFKQAWRKEHPDRELRVVVGTED